MSLRLDGDNHPEVNKLFKQLNNGVPIHYQHFFIIAGDSGYLPSYSDESIYYSFEEASESLKEYVEHIIDSYEPLPDEESEEVRAMDFSNKHDCFIDNWYATKIITGTDTLYQVVEPDKILVHAVKFNRQYAFIDYAEVNVFACDCESPELNF
tara:strand:+ start:949 stop:1407 length:459 start_codon:yes stop_codon:yes gene_type:complete